MDITTGLIRSFQTELRSLRAELDATKAELDVTKAGLDATKAELDTMKAELNVTKLELDHLKFPGALDELDKAVYSKATRAYSLRRLFREYGEGPQVRVRRASDNAERDFRFDKNGKSLESENLDAWLGGSTGYVQVWYDQSASGKNAVMSGTDSRQPTLVRFNGTNC